MFTGLVESTGTFQSLEEGPQSWRMVLHCPQVLDDYRVGDSLACNGCCLTATHIDPTAGTASFDLLEESLRLTQFGHYRPGMQVNLERSLRADTRLGGHFVSGHIDAPGQVRSLRSEGKNTRLEVAFPQQFAQYLIYKGSITIDGISLTVAEVLEDSFVVWLIPHTLAATNLHERMEGDGVNLEFDVLAKYVERILAVKETAPHEG